MTIQMTTDQATEGGSAGVLAQVRTVFNTGRTRSVQWREEQLRAIERVRPVLNTVRTWASTPAEPPSVV